MTLTKRAYIATAVFALLSLLFLASIFFANMRATEVRRDLDFLFQIRVNVGELRTVGFEYALYQEERPKVQTQILLHRLQQQFDRLQHTSFLSDGNSSELVRDAAAGFANCSTLLASLSLQTGAPFAQERNRQTLRLFVLHGDALVSSVDNLTELAVRRIHQAQQISEAIVCAAVAALLGFVVLVIFLLRRTVLAPLKKLTNAVQSVNAGDLAVRLRSNGKGEFGALTRAFDFMLDHIQAYQGRLKDSESRMRAVLDTAADGIMTVDETGIILTANPAAEGIFGLDEASMQGKRVQDLIISLARVDGDLPILSSPIPGRDPLTGEGTGRRTDGHVFSLEYSFSEARVASTRIFVGIVRDISERKSVDQELALHRERLEALVDERTERFEQSERQFRDAFEIAPIGMALVSTEGRWIKVNAAVCRIVGYDNDALLKTDFQTLTYPDDLSADVDQVRAMLEGRITTYQMEKRYVHKAGHLVWVLLNVSLVRDAHDHPVHFVSQIQDITTQKLTGLKIREAHAAAEAANRAKSEFLANMSHEIRTPMNGVLGMLELAMRSSPTVDQREYLATARKSAMGLLSVINDILDFSKIEAGMLTLAPRQFSIREVIKNTLESFGPAVQAKDLSLTVEIDDNVPQKLVADPDRVLQVLSNLVDNAIKFTETGTVAVSVMVPAAGAEEVVLQFDVRDTGIGIEPALQEQVFEAFAQADGSITRRYGGTGLGLSICRRLVKLMGGALWLESEPGVGSIFHFTARFGLFASRPLDTAIPWKGVPSSSPVKHDPAADAPRLDSPSPMEPVSSPADKILNILIAEDNPVNLKLAIVILQSRGHQITTAGDGRSAIDAAAQQNFDVILMDVQMPKLDGYLTTRAIRSAGVCGRRRPRIIALTAYAMAGDRERCLDAGMDDYLAKPYDPAQLIAIVELASNTELTAIGVPNAEIFDVATALPQALGKPGLLISMAALFRKDLPDLVQALRHGIETQDRSEIRRVTHRIKGSASNFSASRVNAAISVLEYIVKANTLDGAMQALAVLEQELADLILALEDFEKNNKEGP